jgi:hemerythrin superfamily protein
MTALDLLRADHRQLAQLFEQVRQSSDYGERRELFEEIRDRLEAHSDLEEEIFYPRFSKIAEWSELMSESIEDHRLMREILAELSATYDREDFNELLDELVDTVEDHVTEEEGEVFPRLLDVLGDSEWNELFEAMIERREGVAAAA